MRLSESIAKRPVLKWVFVSLLGLALVVAVVRALPRAQVPQEAMESVEITCRDTGKVWTMRMAEIDRQLISRKSPLNRSEGLKNTDTGKLTGFSANWDAICDRIDAMQQEAVAEANVPKPPSPPPPPPAAP